jgi:hypothetical protein
LREMFGQETDNDSADVGRDKPLAIHFDILAILECHDDACVR